MPAPDDDDHASSPPPSRASNDHSKPNVPAPDDNMRTSDASGSAKKGYASILYLQDMKELKVLAKRYRTEISAGSSSVLSTFSAFPLDLIKSRMQSYDSNFVHTVKDTYKAEGIRAFWRGVIPPLISVTLVRTLSFSLYQKTKYALDASITRMTGQSPLVIANAQGSYPTLSTMTCFGLAGAVAGAAITTISCPFELTKLNEQLAGKMAREAAALRQAAGDGNVSSVVDSKTGGSWATARRLVRDRGLFRGLYAGYGLHLLRDTIGTGLYFTTYESAKQILGNARGNSATSPYAVVVAGGLCGIVSWVCIYPVDVAKTLYQKELLSAGSGYARRPKIKFFEFGAYRGLGVSVMRSCIINMIFFSNFELMKKQINALEV